ncbi:coagulation factor IX-like [Chrysoperla carnea]|uniref:coagulation factor IX-like n=1 Tax=Chrysoperla carnea TaxID=189513 RepID=UPI001D08DFFD|nr:coagulation factor IX-like [Chrysoperla carnea]
MNDIAILVMDKSFVFNNFVRPVCVDWTSELHKQAFKSESTGYISGWGVQEEPDGNLGETILFGDLNAELKHFQLPFVPSDTCLKEVPVDFKPIVNQSDKICAGTDGYKLCEIDGGAGLTFELDGSFYLMGVASVGPINCNTVKYTTFTNVSSHEQWVKNIYQTTDLTNSTQD